MPAKTMDDLTAFIGQTLKAGSLDPDAGMGRTRGWDSLAHVNLILDIEQWAGVSVPPELVGELTTLKALAGYLRDLGVLAP
jgi:acyl carrier protein